MIYINKLWNTLQSFTSDKGLYESFVGVCALIFLGMFLYYNFISDHIKAGNTGKTDNNRGNPQSGSPFGGNQGSRPSPFNTQNRGINSSRPEGSSNPFSGDNNGRVRQGNPFEKSENPFEKKDNSFDKGRNPFDK